MAELTKQDRIETSKKLVGIEDEIALSDFLAADNDKNLIEAQNKDAPNKKFIEERNALILLYQEELLLIEGTTRSELTEDIIVDSANRVINNSFFPNDPQTPLPSVPDGIWKSLVPVSTNHAIGKTNLEQYPATGARIEQDIIDDINAKITEVELNLVSHLATGLQCDPGGSCSGEDTPPQTTEAACLLDNGSWLSGVDSYSTNTTVDTQLGELEVLIQEWEDRIFNERSWLPTNEKNATRIAKNTIADDDATNAITIIDAWQATQDYDTTTTLPTGFDGAACLVFDAMVEGDFEDAKLQPSTLQLVKDELIARSSYIATREAELIGDDYLGSIDQDLSSGTLNGFKGLYGERMLFMDMRLNTSTGTLSRVKAIERGGEFHGASKASAEIASNALSLVMVATKAAAPGIDTNYLNVKDASSFSVGDRIYIVADDQEELSGSVLEKDGNRVKLSFVIPKKYTKANKTRLYKLL